MQVHFLLKYQTVYGETIGMNIYSGKELPEPPAEQIELQYLDKDYWELRLELPSSQHDFYYSYFLKTEDGVSLPEGENCRTLRFKNKILTAIEVIDCWNNAGDPDNVFYTAPFRKVFNRKKNKAEKEKKHGPGQVFKVKAPLLKKNEVVVVFGNSKTLKNWDTENLLRMKTEGDWWYLQLDVPVQEFPLHYKYGIFNTRKNKFIQFEEGKNRNLNIIPANDKLTVIHDGFIQMPKNKFHGAGVAVPIFSLRSNQGLGIGEFADIKLLADWAAKTGLKLIQLLPINDTTASYTKSDSYPYAAISAFALHPIYINLEAVAGKAFAGELEPLKEIQKKLNNEKVVDYELVIKIKTGVLQKIYELAGEEILESKACLSFIEKNKNWLEPYAVFCYLRDKYKTTEFVKWETNNFYESTAVAELLKPGSRTAKEIAFHFFVQFHLHTQLKDAVDYAHKKEIVIKGDIPIGIYRNACDAWVNPSLYHLADFAGAPPDDFAVKGQNWKLLTYNWEKMKEDGYSWWKQRFAHLSNYFDAFRIDHILGFFRIWSIPEESIEGIMGRFVPAIPVHIGEFGEQTIPFDFKRYCKSFITDEILQEEFGDWSDEIKKLFLQPVENGNYDFLPGFSTQRKVEDYFNSLATGDETIPLKEGLFNLLSNIILFEEPGSQQTRFHFRINMQATASFRLLPFDTRKKLQELYEDYFYKRQDATWYKEAMQKLPTLKRSTEMMICGEDLGMIPKDVPRLMQQLGILSLEIQRMPKKQGIEFSNPHEAPYMSVISPSTHDLSTIRGWWQEDGEKTQWYYNHLLNHWAEAPQHCEAWINRDIVLQHLHSPAMWTIFQIQDLVGMSEKLRRDNPDEERINIPADPEHTWNYRMHISLEDLIKQKEFNNQLKDFIKNSGR